MTEPATPAPAAQPPSATGGDVASGFADERFAAVRAVFEAQLADPAELGASVCITVDGETRLDLWGGWADAARTRPWAADTLVNVYSTTKTMTALTALWLADQGELDFAAPVARYWPEFAQNGKATVKVSHLMSHSAGLSGWRAPVTHDDLYDWEKMTSLLAAQAPFWEPGLACGYHGVTQGYLVGEVMRRITGRSPGRLFREEIAAPLGGDFHIGFGPEHDARVAELTPPPPPEPVPDFTPGELFLNMASNPILDVAATRLRAWRAAQIPAAGGHGNARSVAEIHAVLANGGVAKGRRLLSEAGCRRALEPQIAGVDLILSLPVSYALGFGLAHEMVGAPGRQTIFWCGYGGSLGMIDLEARTTFAYAGNRMRSDGLVDLRALALAQAMWASLAA